MQLLPQRYPLSLLPSPSRVTVARVSSAHRKEVGELPTVSSLVASSLRIRNPGHVAGRRHPVCLPLCRFLAAVSNVRAPNNNCCSRSYILRPSSPEGPTLGRDIEQPHIEPRESIIATRTTTSSSSYILPQQTGYAHHRSARQNLTHTTISYTSQFPKHISKADRAANAFSILKSSKDQPKR